MLTMDAEGSASSDGPTNTVAPTSTVLPGHVPPRPCSLRYMLLLPDRYSEPSLKRYDIVRSLKCEEHTEVM